MSHAGQDSIMTHICFSLFSIEEVQVTWDRKAVAAIKICTLKLCN